MPQCNLCKNLNTQYTNLEKNTYKLYYCDKCGLYFINPIPHENELKNNYETYLEDKGYKYLNKELREYKIRTIWKERLILLKKFVDRIENKRILEIGAGTGEWLETLEEHGANNYMAIEIAKDEFHILKKQFRYKVFNTSLNDFNGGDNFDIICLWDIVEHFSEIEHHMKKIKKLLSQDGLVIFSTINANSFSFKIKKAHWRYFIPPEHIFYLNQKSIKYLSDNYGFDLLYFKTHPQLQAYLSDNRNEQGIKKINIHLYKFKLLLEKIASPFLFNKGEIITFILRNRAINSRCYDLLAKN